MALAFALFAGCVAPEGPAASDPARRVPGPDEGGPPAVAAGRQGTIHYRVAGDGPVHSRYEGDCPSFVFDVPPGVGELVGVLEFTADVPNDVVLDLQSWNGSHAQSWDRPFEFDPSPVEVRAAAPEAGEWYGYVGPGVAGGALSWVLTVRWEGVAPGAFAGLPAERLRDSAEDCAQARGGSPGAGLRP